MSYQTAASSSGHRDFSTPPGASRSPSALSYQQRSVPSIDLASVAISEPELAGPSPSTLDAPRALMRSGAGSTALERFADLTAAALRLMIARHHLLSTADVHRGDFGQILMLEPSTEAHRLAARPWERWYDLEDRRAQHAAAVEAILHVDARLPDAIGEISDLLSTLEVERVPHNVLVALLNATYPVRERIEARPTFVARVEKTLTSALGPERTTRLLASRR